MIDELAKEIHQNAVEHGWWEDERDEAEIFALIHSEWSEALEEARAGRDMVWHGEDGKPEGIAIELIDGVIRILDYLGKIGAEELDELYKTAADTAKADGELESVPKLVNEMHDAVSAISIKNELFGRMAIRMCARDTARVLMTAVYAAMEWIMLKMQLDAWELLREKHEYNKKRPYKHGKKF